MRRVKSEFNGGGSRASFGHHDPDENNFNGSSYITRLSYSLFRSSLALDRSTMVGKTLRRGEANLGGKKKKKKKKKVGNRAMRRGKREREGEKERKKERERETRTREPFVSLAPANTELAAACRRLLCRSHEEDARLLLCSPFVSYWEGHTVVCARLCAVLSSPLFTNGRM